MHPEDLEIKSKNAYCVESTGIDLESEASINRALETAVELLTQDPTNILQHEVFDPLYKMIRFLDNIVDEHKVELVESLCTALSSLDALTANPEIFQNPGAIGTGCAACHEVCVRGPRRMARRVRGLPRGTAAGSGRPHAETSTMAASQAVTSWRASARTESMSRLPMSSMILALRFIFGFFVVPDVCRM